MEDGIGLGLQLAVGDEKAHLLLNAGGQLLPLLDAQFGIRAAAHQVSGRGYGRGKIVKDPLGATVVSSNQAAPPGGAANAGFSAYLRQ